MYTQFFIWANLNSRSLINLSTITFGRQTPTKRSVRLVNELEVHSQRARNNKKAKVIRDFSFLSLFPPPKILHLCGATKFENIIKTVDKSWTKSIPLVKSPCSQPDFAMGLNDMIAYEVGVNSRSTPELQRVLQQQAFRFTDAAEPLIEADTLTFTTLSAMFQIHLDNRGRT